MSLVKNPLVPTSRFALKPRSPFLKLNFRNDLKKARASSHRGAGDGVPPFENRYNQSNS